MVNLTVDGNNVIEKQIWLLIGSFFDFEMLNLTENKYLLLVIEVETEIALSYSLFST